VRITRPLQTIALVVVFATTFFTAPAQAITFNPNWTHIGCQESPNSVDSGSCLQTWDTYTGNGFEYRCGRCGQTKAGTYCVPIDTSYWTWCGYPGQS
jgi:hypothetical protein